MTTKQPLPVLIVGAGPAGLMMAHELSRMGIAVVIIDKEVQKNVFSRAIAVQARTLEIFAALDLDAALNLQANEISRFEIWPENQQPIVIALEKASSGFSRLHSIEQPHTELVLEQALARRGQHISRGVTLVDFSEHDDHIQAHTIDLDGNVSIAEYSYIIGADGAHSTVRKKMNNKFTGSTYKDAFILADAICATPQSHDTVRIFFRDQNFLALLPLHGHNHYRLIALRRGETQRKGPPPTIEEFRDLAQKLIPFEFSIKNHTWVSRFFVQCRSARDYQRERIFLVGDAAHIHSPAGGQGMNTSLQDAFNLAWKINFVLKGQATVQLLQTYSEERKPVGDFLLKHTDRLFKFMVNSSILARMIRRFILPYVAKNLQARQKIVDIGSQVAIRYDAGFVCSCSSHRQKYKDLRIGVRIPNLLVKNLQGHENNEIGRAHV